MIPMIAGLLIVFGIPAGAAIYFLRRRDGSFLTFLVGIASFIFSQMVLRMPLLDYLGKHWEWLMFLPYTSLIGYYLFMGFTAGLFEETGRLIGFRFLRRGHVRWLDGLAFGLGHGGIEAVWVGVNGILPALLGGNGGWGGLVSGAERLFAMIIQVGLSILVLYGVKEKRPGYYVLAILLHGLVDFLIILGNPWILEGIFAAEALLALVLIIRAKKRWNDGFSCSLSGAQE